jgi:hypothetical protein
MVGCMNLAPRLVLAPLVLAVALVSGACSSSQEKSASPTTTVAAPTTAASAASEPTTPSTEKAPAAPGSTSKSSESSVPAGSNGAAKTSGVAQAGTEYCVAGVGGSDELNLRSAPDPKAGIVYKLHPQACGVHPDGPTQQVGSSTWVKVTVNGEAKQFHGWVNNAFLLKKGATCPQDPNACSD